MKALRSSRLKGFVCEECQNRLRRSQRGLASTSTPPEIYDVVTVGGGPVGLALVAALSEPFEAIYIFSSDSLQSRPLLRSISKQH